MLQSVPNERYYFLLTGLRAALILEVVLNVFAKVIGLVDDAIARQKPLNVKVLNE